MESLRPAGINERRCIVRQTLGYYRNLIIGGIYATDRASDQASVEDAAVKALKHCVSTHPILSAVIIGEETEAPVFARPPKLDLHNHFELLTAQQLSEDTLDEHDLIKAVLARVHDRELKSRDQIPPWKIVVTPLPPRKDIDDKRYLILLAYYHSHGDGKSGLAFHKTFLEGLKLASDSNCPYTADWDCATPKKPLPPTIDQAVKLSISWSYLLMPLFGAYLPKSITKILNLRASTTPEAEDQWGGQITRYDPAGIFTGVEFISISGDKVQKILSECKAHKVTFTGLLHQVIVRALSQALPRGANTGSFVSGTPVDLRRHANGLTDGDMAVCASAYFELFPRVDAEQSTGSAIAAKDESLWTAARATSEGLAKCAASAADQPIGLLAYLRDFYPWMSGQIGKKRENSYELSNLLSFDPGDDGQGGWKLESMIFSQPANAVGGCLSFNCVTRKGGDMTLSLSWQKGVLGVDDEQKFAEEVCSSIRRSLEILGSA